jgi:hypothetical protein
MCQADIQGASSTDLSIFFPDMRPLLDNSTAALATQTQTETTAMANTKSAGKKAAVKKSSSNKLSNLIEYRGVSNPDELDVPKQCNRSALGLRFLQMGHIVSRCSHWHEVTEAEKRYMVLAHASCVGGNAPSEEHRIRYKIWWLNQSGVWFLPNVTDLQV